METTSTSIKPTSSVNKKSKKCPGTPCNKKTNIRLCNQRPHQSKERLVLNGCGKENGDLDLISVATGKCKKSVLGTAMLNPITISLTNSSSASSSTSTTTATSDPKLVAQEEVGRRPHAPPNKASYKCPLCRAAFEEKARYNNHIQIHEGLRPFVCPYCSYGFDQEIRLLKHVAREHSGDPAFQCARCGKHYKTLRGLTSHENLKKKCGGN